MPHHVMGNGGVRQDLTREVAAPEVILNSPQTGVQRVRLGVLATGRAGLVNAPVVQHTRDVDNLVGPQPFNAPQSQVMILRPFVPNPETAD
jgi:hypothetical protein